METENLYFIAIIPPKELCDEITAFKLHFQNHYKSKAALKVMPHITLKAPFKLPASEHLELQEWFKRLYINFGPFQLDLKGFGAFPNPKGPVIYVNPIINVPLFALQKEIIRSFHNSYPAIHLMNLELKFKPHITVAYRDLEFNNFLEAWKIYEKKEYVASFRVDCFYLLQHNSKEWKISDSYKLIDKSANSG